MKLGATVRILVSALFAFNSAFLWASDASRIDKAPKIEKIDPPDWWAGFPRPMLLIRGENLSGAQFTLSDPRLGVQQAHISTNGHWVELWLSAAPEKAEVVTIRAHNAQGDASAKYQFRTRRALTEGYAGFSSKDAMYLMMTDRFADGDLTNDGLRGDAKEDSPEAVAERARARGWHGGDLKGIAQHLDYIQGTGFTTVWFTPVYANQNETDSYHGYGATDMYGVDPHYGSLADLQALGAALHGRHMKLVLDTVPNHIGPGHPWVEDEPDPAWLHGTKRDHHDAVGDMRSLVDPHAAWRDQRDVLQGWFANTLPDLNQENPATEQYLIQNAIWWIEKTGADGLRIDTFPYVNRAFWGKFHSAIHALYPNLTNVGEVFNCDAVITSAFAGGVTRNGPDTGLDTPFDFPSYCALRDVFLKSEPMTRLADVWRQDALYPHPERLIAFLGNHDTSRFASASGSTPESMREAFAVLLTMRGMPQVYSGDEIAMTGGDDPDNRHDFPGGWPRSNENAFVNPTTEQAQMHEWVRSLLTMRASSPALLQGEMQLLHVDRDSLAYVRYILEKGSGANNLHGPDRVLIVVNRSSSPLSVSIPLHDTELANASRLKTMLGDGNQRITDGLLVVDMPAASVWIGSAER